MANIEREYTEIQLPVPWGHIAANVYGSPTDKKILMVHGILDNAGSFERLLKLLPKDYQYVVIDLPGHGHSSHFAPGIPLIFFHFVYAIKLVCEALKWDNFIYIGHSFGAQIGIYFSIVYPGVVKNMIALDGLMPSPVKEDNFTYKIRRLLDLPRYAFTNERLYTKAEILHALQFRRAETLNLPAAEAMFKRAVTKVGDLYKYNRDVRLRYPPNPCLTEGQHLSMFHKLTSPLLLIIVKNELRWKMYTTIAQSLETLSRYNDDINVIFVSGNHDVHNNNPERVAPHICNYLNSMKKSKL